MEMHQVRYFLALCEVGSFTRAAHRCGVTQPSLTNAIRALERELKGTLFHRKPKVELTDLGRIIRPHLQDIARNAQVVQELARVAAPPVLPPIPAGYLPTTYGATDVFHAAEQS